MSCQVTAAAEFNELDIVLMGELFRIVGNVYEILASLFFFLIFIKIHGFNLNKHLTLLRDSTGLF